MVHVKSVASVLEAPTLIVVPLAQRVIKSLVERGLVHIPSHEVPKHRAFMLRIAKHGTARPLRERAKPASLQCFLETVAKVRLGFMSNQIRFLHKK